MKLLFYYLVSIFFVCTSCRTSKESMYAERRQAVINQSGAYLQWFQSDSTTRFWFYQADSSFYFHPDSGLYGFSGWLAVEETYLKNSMGLSRKDTASYLLEEHLVGSFKSERKASKRAWGYLIGLGLVALGLWYIYLMKKWS